MRITNFKCHFQQYLHYNMVVNFIGHVDVDKRVPEKTKQINVSRKKLTNLINTIVLSSSRNSQESNIQLSRRKGTDYIKVVENLTATPP